jgi:hypothetical protein
MIPSTRLTPSLSRRLRRSYSPERTQQIACLQPAALVSQRLQTRPTRPLPSVGQSHPASKEQPSASGAPEPFAHEISMFGEFPMRLCTVAVHLLPSHWLADPWPPALGDRGGLEVGAAVVLDCCVEGAGAPKALGFSSARNESASPRDAFSRLLRLGRERHGERTANAFTRNRRRAITQ